MEEENVQQPEAEGSAVVGKPASSLDVLALGGPGEAGIQAD